MEGRNPLFIKSEFSHGLSKLEKALHIVKSQSFIHQVRILSLMKCLEKELQASDCLVAILYSSSQNSLLSA